MNRRGFLSALLKAGAGFAVLPSAVTYARQWKPVDSGLIVPVATATIEIPHGYRYHEIRLYINGRLQRQAILSDWYKVDHLQLSVNDPWRGQKL